MNIEIVDSGKEGEYCYVSYFLNNDPEARLDVEFEALVNHVAYEGLNEGSAIKHLEDGEVDVKDVTIDPEIWAEENLKEAFESYLIHTLKNKS